MENANNKLPPIAKPRDRNSAKAQSTARQTSSVETLPPVMTARDVLSQNSQSPVELPAIHERSTPTGKRPQSSTRKLPALNRPSLPSRNSQSSKITLPSELAHTNMRSRLSMFKPGPPHPHLQPHPLLQHGIPVPPNHSSRYMPSSSTSTPRSTNMSALPQPPVSRPNSRRFTRYSHLTPKENHLQHVIPVPVHNRSFTNQTSPMQPRPPPQRPRNSDAASPRKRPTNRVQGNVKRTGVLSAMHGENAYQRMAEKYRHGENAKQKARQQTSFYFVKTTDNAYDVWMPDVYRKKWYWLRHPKGSSGEFQTVTKTLSSYTIDVNNAIMVTENLVLRHDKCWVVLRVPQKLTPYVQDTSFIREYVHIHFDVNSPQKLNVNACWLPRSIIIDETGIAKNVNLGVQWPPKSSGDFKFTKANAFGIGFMNFETQARISYTFIKGWASSLVLDYKGNTRHVSLDNAFAHRNEVLDFERR
jgi:hypothetical protein